MLQRLNIFALLVIIGYNNGLASPVNDTLSKKSKRYFIGLSGSVSLIDKSAIPYTQASLVSTFQPIDNMDFYSNAVRYAGWMIPSAFAGFFAKRNKISIDLGYWHFFNKTGVGYQGFISKSVHDSRLNLSYEYTFLSHWGMIKPNRILFQPVIGGTLRTGYRNLKEEGFDDPPGMLKIEMYHRENNFSECLQIIGGIRLQTARFFISMHVKTNLLVFVRANYKYAYQGYNNDGTIINIYPYSPNGVVSVLVGPDKLYKDKLLFYDATLSFGWIIKNKIIK